MISKKDLQAYEYNSMEDYFDYVVESRINGNFSQVKRLIKDMSKKQKLSFQEFLYNENNLIESDARKYCSRVNLDLLGS